jgi:hypothetical protein
MRPLLLYVLLKAIRQRLAGPMILAPVLLVGAPLAGLIVRNLIRGKALYPFVLDGVPHARSMIVFANVAAAAAALCAGTAAFWIFRQEILDRSVASFIMATRPLRISLTALLYGVAAGVASFVLTLAVMGLLTWSVPPRLGLVFAAFAGAAVFAAAVAVLLAAVSPDPGMLLPLLILTLPMTTFLLMASVNAAVIAAVAIAVLPLIAGRVLERRCAG